MVRTNPQLHILIMRISVLEISPYQDQEGRRGSRIRRVTQRPTGTRVVIPTPSSREILWNIPMPESRPGPGVLRLEGTKRKKRTRTTTTSLIPMPKLQPGLLVEVLPEKYLSPPPQPHPTATRTRDQVQAEVPTFQRIRTRFSLRSGDPQLRRRITMGTTILFRQGELGGSGVGVTLKPKDSPNPTVQM